jgi:hypothetical protein
LISAKRHEYPLAEVVVSAYRTGYTPVVDCVLVGQADWDFLRALQIKLPWEWPAVFSANSRGDIWPFVTYGLTPEWLREDVRGLSPVVDEIADSFLSYQRIGGRFFIDENGAYVKDAAGNCSKFAYFVMTS